MAAKRVDPLKAKAAKQKKIAIGGMVLLVAILAVQGPKTLKLLKGPQAEPAVVATPTTTPPPATSGTPVPPPATGATAPGEAPVATGAELASVPDSDQAPVVDEGQLATFERFSSKDPFVQQAVAVPTPTAPAKQAPETKPAAGTATEGSEPINGSEPTKGEGASAATPDGGFTTGGSAPAAGAKVAAATSIAVNGSAEDVKVEASFPAVEPTFVLASVAANGKSVEIGIAGGEYANGGETLKLSLGKKITLQNTADGSRYELELLSIEGFPLPTRKG